MLFIAGIPSANTIHQNNTLVLKLDPNGTGATCDPIPEFSPKLRMNVGATVSGKFVSCGGSGTSTPRECRIYEPAQKAWKWFPSTNKPRTYAESVQLSEDTFWILGRCRDLTLSFASDRFNDTY